MDFTSQDLTNPRITKQDLIEHGVIRQNKVPCVRDALPGDHTAIQAPPLAVYEDYAEPLAEY
jgi:hypothetical protein